MTTTPGNASSNLPGKPPVVDLATWGPTSRPVPQWTGPGATPVATLGRQGDHH